MNSFINKDNIEIPTILYNENLDMLINQVYKVLCIAEQCELSDDYEAYFEYIYKVVITILGNKVLFDDTKYIYISTCLLGLCEKNETNHARIKKIVFECTNILQKLKKPL